MVGIISDTHGLLRREAIRALQGVQLIIHAGDIGKPEILEELRKIAPVVAVRGNMDGGEWANTIPEEEVLEIGEVNLYILHDVNRINLDPGAAGFNAVISGHSHRPSVKKRHNGVTYLNPGSAGPRRFKLPVTLALVHLNGDDLDVRFIDLEKQV